MSSVNAACTYSCLRRGSLPLLLHFFRPPLSRHMAGIRYVSQLSSSLRPATTKATGLRSRYVLARTLATANASPFAALDTFTDRHVGPDATETAYMLKQLGYDSMDAFIAATVPAHIRIPEDGITNATIPSLSESELTRRAKALGRDNKIFKSYIGMGYHNNVVPPVILRNVSSSVFRLHAVRNPTGIQVIESPAWYTPYTPYQPEIAQGVCATCVMLTAG